MTAPGGWLGRWSRRASEQPFPARISRSLTWALGTVLGVVMLVGAISLTLALQIYLTIDASAREFGQILKLNQIHSVFDDMIFELHQIDSTRQLDHTVDAVLLQEEIARQLDAVGEEIRGHADTAGREEAVLGSLRQFSDEGRAVANRLFATGHLARSDLDWLSRATHEVPRLTDELAGLREFRITRLHERSEKLIEVMVVVFVAFTVVGGALVVVARLAASRSISSPLHRLAEAARGIAEGRLETRVSIRRVNEIGLLAHTFNAMAARLQEHDREMRSARDALEQKVREVKALYQIGTEIARLQQLDRILQSVVDKARELLRADAVVLRLFAPQGGDLVPPARSGPADAFRGDGEGLKSEPSGTDHATRGVALIRPEYMRGHFAVPIRLGTEQLGTIQVSTRAEREFTLDEIELISGLAAQAATAIERVRLSEEVRSMAVIQERERLAREMHDGLAQELGLLHMKLYGALERAADAAAVTTAMREMVHITDHAYEDVRQSIFGLRTFVSRSLGLVPTLTEYLHEFSAQNGIRVELDVAEGAIIRVSPATELQVVRIIQEALSNVRKHARAEHARVRLEREGNWIRVAIEDQGVGWDPVMLPDRRHFGLQGMRERAEGLGGRLQIDSAPGRGTRVVATLPGGRA